MPLDLLEHCPDPWLGSRAHDGYRNVGHSVAMRPQPGAEGEQNLDRDSQGGEHVTLHFSLIDACSPLAENPAQF